ncbi:ATP-binding cassette sub-family F member 3 [Sphaerodactylus townsendi]|uniref:ATP-binding cassette sub-family F member 3 n=1 Tax=Sphaerodactylus townsendi TaxID=933632 RepID=UPI002026521F|nr:ATP-binding cassette sub-family F member 3 [Sphaerodactylus townsendi]
MAASCVEILRREFPELDGEMFDYVTGILHSGSSDFESVDDLFEAVGELLQDVSRDSKDDEEIRAICQQMYNTLHLDSENSQGDRQVLLDAPIQLSKITDSYDSGLDVLPGLWVKRDQTSVVNTKKLEKAEARLKAKQNKKQERDSVKSCNPLVLEEASASQAASKKETRLETSGKNKSYDVRIENFDVSFGERVLLTGAELNLAYGRRYGLVGRNGLGKTTLLKMIASRSLRIPSHISILHVEQEVAGDDTPALQSVLECDTTRESLLKEEKMLTAQVNSGRGDGTEGSRLSEIYARLEEIEADKAPASPNFYILDEPTNHLDMETIEALAKALNKFRGGLMLVSHDERFIRLVCQELWVCGNGAVQRIDGGFDEYRNILQEQFRKEGYL